MSVLEQDHYAYDDYTVLDTVIMGNKVLSKVKKEMDELYADYSDEHAERIGELQIQFDEIMVGMPRVMRQPCSPIWALPKICTTL